jgi:5-methylcytosine-specific restriction endonuclease McrA
MSRAAERSRSLQYRTLVLNADYRPLTTFPLSLVSAQEAVSTLWRERADTIEAWPDAFFRSPSVTIAVPKVMVLRQFAPISGEPKFNRRGIFLRDHFTCQYCAKVFPSQELTFDHLIPKSRGGKTVWTNVVTACIPCNKEKANSLPHYSGRKRVVRMGLMRPLKEPRRPTHSELLRAGLQFLSNDLMDDFASWLYWDSELRA